MTLNTRPIVDACYFDLASDMLKVRFVSYVGEQIKDVVVEDVRGNINIVDINAWQKLRLIPCCYAGRDINQLKLG